MPSGDGGPVPPSWWLWPQLQGCGGVGLCPHSRGLRAGTLSLPHPTLPDEPGQMQMQSEWGDTVTFQHNISASAI